MAGKQTLTQRIALEGGKEIQAELEALGAAGKKVWNELQVAAAQFKGPDSSAVAKLKDIQSQLASVSKSFKDAGTTLKDVGSGLSTYITAPLAAAGFGIVKIAADFEAGMNKLQVATQATGAEFTALEAKAQEIGKNTSFGATEAAQAMTELAKTGVETKDILEGAADATVKLATANDTQLAPAAKLISDVMQQFGKNVSDLPGVVDEISGAVNKSKLDFDDYRLAIAQTGSIVGKLGGDFNDFNAALTLTTSAFASGSDAGTSFKTFFTRLVPQTKEAIDIMKEYGLATQDAAGKVKSAFFDAQGKFKGFAAAADLLKEKLGNLSDEKLNKVLSDLFGSDSMRTGIELVRRGGDEVRRTGLVIKEFKAQASVDANMKGFLGQVEQLKGSFENLAIAIGKSGILKFLTDMVKGLGDFVDKLGAISPKVLLFSTIIAGIVAAIGPVLFALGVMSRGFGIVAEGAAVLSGGLAGLAVKFPALEGMFAGLGRAASLIGGPWVKLAALLLFNFNDILKAAKEFYQGLFGDPQKTTQDWIQSWSAAILEFVSAIKKAFNGDFSGAFDSLGASFKDAITGLGEAIRAAATSWIGTLAEVWIAWRAGAKLAAAAMRGEFLKTLGIIRADAVKTGVEVNAALSGAGAKGSAAGFGAGLLGRIGNIGKAILGLVGGPFGALVIAIVEVGEHWDDIVRGFENGVDMDGTTREVSGFWENLGKAAALAKKDVSEIWNNPNGFWAGIGVDLQKGNDQWADLWNKTVPVVEKALGGIRAAADTAGNAWSDAGLSLGNKLREGIIKGYEGTKEAFKELSDGLFDTSKETMDKIEARMRASHGNAHPLGPLVDHAKADFKEVSAASKKTAEDIRADQLKAARDNPWKFWAGDSVSEIARVRDFLMHGLQPGTEAAKKNIEDLGQTMVRVFRNGKLVADETKVSIESLSQAKGPQEALKAGAEGVVKVWDAVAQKFTEVKIKGEGAVDGIAAKVAALSQNQKQGIFNNLVQQAEAARLGIAKEFDGVPGSVTKSLEGLKLSAQQFKAIPDGARDAISAAGLEFKKLADGSFQLVDKAKLAADGKSIVDTAKAAADEANKALAKTGDPLKDIAKDAAKPLADTRTDAQKTADAITKSFEAVKGFDWTKFGEGAKAAFTELVAGSGTSKTALEALKAALDALGLPALQTALTGIGTALTGLGTPLTTFQGQATTTFDVIIAKAKETAAAVAAAFSGGAAVEAPGAASDAGNGQAPAPEAGGSFSGIETSATDVFGRIRTAATDTAKFITDAFLTLTVDWTKLSAGADTTWQTIKDKATTTAQAVKDAFEKLNVDWTKLTNGLADAIAQIQRLGTEATSAASAVQSAASQMVAAFNQVAAAAREAAQAAASVSSGGGGSSSDSGGDAEGFARGGPIRGRGTSTSDSIPLWGSHGEFMIRAASVRKYGRAFMEALNAGRLKLPGFAKGGLVAAPTFKMGLPAFAGGGLVDGLAGAMAGMNPGALTIQADLGGLEPAANLRPAVINIGGEQVPIMAPEDSIKKLGQMAARRRMASAGRKPSWA